LITKQLSPVDKNNVKYFHKKIKQNNIYLNLIKISDIMKIIRIYITALTIVILTCLISYYKILNINKSQEIALSEEFTESKSQVTSVPYFAIFKTISSNYPFGNK
jgi:hypothetical protein